MAGYSVKAQHLIKWNTLKRIYIYIQIYICIYGIIFGDNLQISKSLYINMRHKLCSVTLFNRGTLASSNETIYSLSALYDILHNVVKRFILCQIIGHILAWMSYPFVSTLHHDIIINRQRANQMLITYIIPVECVSKIKSVLPIICNAIYRAVRFQFTYFSPDDRENTYRLNILSSSNRKYKYSSIV